MLLSRVGRPQQQLLLNCGDSFFPRQCLRWRETPGFVTQCGFSCELPETWLENVSYESGKCFVQITVAWCKSLSFKTMNSNLFFTKSSHTPKKTKKTWSGKLWLIVLVMVSHSLPDHVFFVFFGVCVLFVKKGLEVMVFIYPVVVHTPNKTMNSNRFFTKSSHAPKKKQTKTWSGKVWLIVLVMVSHSLPDHVCFVFFCFFWVLVKKRLEFMVLYIFCCCAHTQQNHEFQPVFHQKLAHTEKKNMIWQTMADSFGHGQPKFARSWFLVFFSVRASFLWKTSWNSWFCWACAQQQDI